jgi:ribonuclease HI
MKSRNCLDLYNMKTVEIYTDGACSGNPGPGGWGAVLKYGDTIKEIYGSDANTTNNKMEITAAIEGLKALKISDNNMNGKTVDYHVIIYTDSTYLKDGITSWIHKWQQNNWRTAKKEPVKNMELWQALLQLTNIHKVEWRWIKAHNGHKYNEMADMLACKGKREA